MESESRFGYRKRVSETDQTEAEVRDLRIGQGQCCYKSMRRVARRGRENGRKLGV